jgi:hypothetical protein
MCHFIIEIIVVAAVVGIVDVFIITFVVLKVFLSLCVILLLR